MNLASIGAAYGVVVAVFQWGWLGGVFGLEETMPVITVLPMMMFAILFGLSMDYEVFLLSRIREQYLLTHRNAESVVDGIASTARVITSAAAIMVVVFLGFVYGDNVIIKQLGLGLATAILVDATIVRVVLVPSTMVLLGDANWWMPRWLDRLLPRVDVEGEAGLTRPRTDDPRRKALAGLVLAYIARRVETADDLPTLRAAVAALAPDAAGSVDERARTGAGLVLRPLATGLLAEAAGDQRTDPKESH
jgi:uncharacterized membrane protein YdfJ with MMPL/SSD domain